MWVVYIPQSLPNRELSSNIGLYYKTGRCELMCINPQCRRNLTTWKVSAIVLVWVQEGNKRQNGLVGIHTAIHNAYVQLNVALEKGYAPLPSNFYETIRYNLLTLCWENLNNIKLDRISVFEMAFLDAFLNLFRFSHLCHKGFVLTFQGLDLFFRVSKDLIAYIIGSLAHHNEEALTIRYFRVLDLTDNGHLHYQVLWLTFVVRKRKLRHKKGAFPAIFTLF